MKKARKEGYLKLQKSRQKLAVIIPLNSMQNALNFPEMEIEMETEILHSKQSELCW